MSNPPSQTEHYRHMASEHRRLAANASFAETRKFHRMMAENYSRLAGGSLSPAGTARPPDGL
jgi:hypothetical protein